MCRPDLPSQEEIQSFHKFSQEILPAGDEYKAKQVVEAFVGDRMKGLEDAEPEEVASMLKRYGGNARMYAEDEAKKMKLMTRVMRNEDNSRKYRKSLLPIYNPNSPALVGEVKVCPLYFIYIQCFPCHKFCYYYYRMMLIPRRQQPHNQR